MRFAREPPIAIDADADIAIWDPQEKRTIRHASLHDRADYTPYEGLEVTGWPTTVLLRGTVMIRDGMLVGAKGQGRYTRRNLSSLAR